MSDLAPSIETPARLKRDEDGLIIGYPYRYTPEGRVDYRALVDRRYLFVIDSRKDAVVKAQGKPIDECDLSLVNERWLRIRQAGFNQLLNLRGYRALEYHSLSVSPDKAAVVCTIELIGNYESEGLPVVCSAIASASLRSMDKHFVPYLETFAENRAFARCVKRALQINILSEDEIDAEATRQQDDPEPEAPAQGLSSHPWQVLKTLCTNRRHPITFAALQKRAVEHNAALTPDKEDERIKSDPASWTDWDSIQPIDVWLLDGKIKEADAAAAAAAKASKKGAS